MTGVKCDWSRDVTSHAVTSGVATSKTRGQPTIRLYIKSNWPRERLNPERPQLHNSRLLKRLPRPGGEPGIFLGFSFIFSFKSSAFDHSATAPPYHNSRLLFRRYRSNALVSQDLGHS